eukprot:638005-Hanusia_phi.AAC.2
MAPPRPFLSAWCLIGFVAVLCVSNPPDFLHRTPPSMLSTQSVSMKALLKLLKSKDAPLQSKFLDTGDSDSNQLLTGSRDTIQNRVQFPAATVEQGFITFHDSQQPEYEPKQSKRGNSKFDKFFQKVDNEIHELSAEYKRKGLPSRNELLRTQKKLDTHFRDGTSSNFSEQKKTARETMSSKNFQSHLKSDIQNAALAQIIKSVGLKNLHGSQALYELLTSKDLRFQELLQNGTSQSCESMNGLKRLETALDLLREKFKGRNLTMMHDSKAARGIEIEHLVDVDDSLRSYRSELEANGMLESQYKYLKDKLNKAVKRYKRRRESDSKMLSQLQKNEKELVHNRDIASQILSLIQSSVFAKDEKASRLLLQAEGIAKGFKNGFDLPDPRKILLSVNASESLQDQQRLQQDLDDINMMILKYEKESAEMHVGEENLLSTVEKGRSKLQKVFPVITDHSKVLAAAKRDLLMKEHSLHKAIDQRLKEKAKLGLEQIALLQDFEATEELLRRIKLLMKDCVGDADQRSTDSHLAASSRPLLPTSKRTRGMQHGSPNKVQSKSFKGHVVEERRVSPSIAEIRVEKQLSNEIANDIRRERSMESNEDSGLASVASMIINKPQ